MQKVKASEEVWHVMPVAVACVKCQLNDAGKDKKKVFLNICTCKELPAPSNIREEELSAMIESSNVQFKIPLAIGEPHAEADNAGQLCEAYECLVNELFWSQCAKDSELFRAYLVMVAMDLLEDKYGVALDRNNWSILKNRKKMGVLKEQVIRQQPRPLIEVLETKEVVAITSYTTDVLPPPASNRPVPRHSFTQENVTEKDGKKGLLRVRIHLPGISSAEQVVLQLSEQRLRLSTHNLTHFLDVALPVRVVCDGAEAFLHVETQELNVKAFVNA